MVLGVLVVRWRRLLAALAGAALLNACGGGGNPFDDPFWVDSQVQVVDLDGDGLADVVTLATWVENYQSKVGHLKVYRQTAPGVFAAPIDHVLPRYPWRFAIGDMDGDGRPDVVATHPDLQQVSVLLQDPAAPGRFLAPVGVDVGGTVYKAVLGDFDGDGRTDIVATDDLRTSTGLVLLRQDPARPAHFLAPQHLETGHPTWQVAAADFDDDGRLDLVAAGGGSVSVLFQRDGAGFTPPLLLASPGVRSVDMLAATDMTGDGRADVVFVLAVNLPAGFDTTDVVIVPRAAAPGRFGAGVQTGRTVGRIWDYALGDIDLDGWTDLVQGSGSRDPDLLVLRAQPSTPPSLSVAASIELPARISPVAIGDVNADGRPDVLALGFDYVWVLRQQAAAFGFEAPRQLR